MGEPDLLRELAELRRRIEDLERAPRLGRTSYHEPGTWRFYDVNGVMRFQVGRPAVGLPGEVNFLYERPDGGRQSVGLGALFVGNDLDAHGLLITQPDGTNILQSRASDPSTPGHPFAGTILRNFAGQRSVWVDNLGFAEPGMFFPWALGIDGNTADSGSFVTVAEAQAARYYPFVFVEYRVDILTGSPTVEVQVERYGGSGEIIFGPFQSTVDEWVWGDTTFAGDHPFGGRFPYRIAARIAAGSGTARVVGTAFYASFASVF